MMCLDVPLMALYGWLCFEDRSLFALQSAKKLENKRYQTVFIPQNFASRPPCPSIPMNPEKHGMPRKCLGAMTDGLSFPWNYQEPEDAEYLLHLLCYRITSPVAVLRR